MRAELGNNALDPVTDVSGEQSVIAPARHIQQQYRKLDILVNSAGIEPHDASMAAGRSPEAEQYLRTQRVSE